jgi:hypothetical protein
VTYIVTTTPDSGRPDTTPSGSCKALTCRNQTASAREQWAIVHHVNGLTVEHGDPEHAEWEEVKAGPFGTVADALAATPAMRRLHQDFTLSPPADLDEHALAALLDLRADEGSSNPGSWDQADLTACDWPSLGHGRWTRDCRCSPGSPA